jgi:hypothetical protein
MTPLAVCRDLGCVPVARHAVISVGIRLGHVRWTCFQIEKGMESGPGAEDELAFERM